MSEDAQLQHHVLAALAWEPSVAAAHIGVAAEAGVVTLSGHVASFAEKHAAEFAARGVKGVKAVVERIEVRLPDDIDQTDEDIAAAAAARLAMNTVAPKNAVVATVEDGWVTLSGAVEWNFQKEAAEADVRPLLGVIGLSNEIAIAPKVNAGNLSDEIMHALHRSWFFDPQTIKVTVEDGRVRLTGAVTSPHDRQVAAATAWSAPGVTQVDNDLIVV